MFILISKKLTYVQAVYGLIIAKVLRLKLLPYNSSNANVLRNTFCIVQ